MNDDQPVHELMRTLDPSAEELARVESAVMDAWGAPAPETRSLAAEWIDLFRIRPFLHPALALVAALVIVTTPIGAVLMLASSVVPDPPSLQSVRLKDHPHRTGPVSSSVGASS